MPQLFIFDDSVRGVDLPRQPLIIGRSARSDIPIEDRLLSRKHCAILPAGAGFRLVDLKSAHGTWLNGARIDKHTLEFDDVIEVGTTVMVYLESGTWTSGEGLARVRNPVKAQTLLSRLRRSERERQRIPLTRVPRPAGGARGTRKLLEILPMLLADAGPGAQSPAGPAEALLDRLVDYASYKTIALWVRRHPQVRRAVARAVRRALAASLPGSWDAFRSRLREDLREALLSIYPPARVPEDDDTPPPVPAETAASGAESESGEAREAGA